MPQVVDGSFHYAPEAMTLFDYSQRLTAFQQLISNIFKLIVRLTSGILNVEDCSFSYPAMRRNRPSKFRQGRCLLLTHIDTFCTKRCRGIWQEWEERAKKEPTFMYVMPLGPVAS